jgi:hypothetical protein
MGCSVSDTAKLRQLADFCRSPVLYDVLTRIHRGDFAGALFKIKLDFDKVCDIDGVEQAIIDADLADPQFREYLEQRIERRKR